jgi:putative N-acetylglucosamine-6-phosphate deacetylase
MTPFHHRDPGIIGILGMETEVAPFFSMIVDGIHSHPYVVKFAQKAAGAKCVLITDAVPAMGLPNDHNRIEKQDVVVINE